LRRAKPAGRARIAAAPRDRILRTAARLYALQGYGGTSVREIAQAAGVTKPLVHYYFGSKERLFASLLHEAVDCCRTAAAAVLRQDAPAARRLHDVLRAQFQQAREAPEVVAFAHEVMTMPGLLPVGFDYKSEGREFFEMYVRLIEEGQRSGEFRRVDPRAVVVLAVATVAMYAAAVLAGDVDEIPADAEETIYDLMVRGIGVAPAAARPALRRPPKPSARHAAPAVAAIFGLLLGAGRPAAAAAAAVQADTLRLSLAGCLDRALAVGEEMRLVDADVATARAAYVQARADVFPQVTLGSTYTRQVESVFRQGDTGLDVEPFEPDTTALLDRRVRELERALPTAALAGLSGLFDAGPFASENKWDATVSVTQKLLEGTSLWSAVHVARHALRAVENQREDRRREVTLLVREAYLAALLADRGVEIAVLGLEQADRQLERVRLRHEAGQASEFDRLQAEVLRDNQVPVVKEARNLREVAYLQLRGIANLPLETPLRLVTPLLDEASVPADPHAAVDTTGIVRGALTNAGLVALEEALAARRAAVSVASRDKWPGVSLFVNFSQQAFPVDVMPGQDDWRKDVAAGVRLSWNLFDGLRTRGAIQDARARVALAEQVLHQGREDVYLLVARNRGELERAAADVRSRGRTVQLARRALDLATLRYEEGASSLLEVEDARLASQLAQGNEARARHDYFVALARLERYSSRPLFADLVRDLAPEGQ
jgi:outer membrane protein TolC